MSMQQLTNRKDSITRNSISQKSDNVYKKLQNMVFHKTLAAKKAFLSSAKGIISPKHLSCVRTSGSSARRVSIYQIHTFRTVSIVERTDLDTMICILR